MLKQAVKFALRSIGYQVLPIAADPSIREKHFDMTDREWDIYRRVQPYTMISVERIIANMRGIDHVIKHSIPGDIVECGVWRGGSSMAMALALGDARRTIWMYDTYEGMTEATHEDRIFSGTPAADILQSAREHEVPEKSLVIACAALEYVQENMRSTGYPLEQVRFIKGPVEKTIPAHIPESISILRIDTDWYASTKHELVHLYPLLSAGGILMIDDYGHWQGARQAVDEYFAGTKTFLNRIDNTGRIVIKA